MIRNTQKLVLAASIAVTVANQAAAGIDEDGSHIHTRSISATMKCADFDADGEVGAADLAALLGMHGRCRDCEYDINDDGVVNRRDQDLLIGQWGSTDCATADEAEICESDLDGDGVIGSRDLAMVLGHYGKCSKSEADLDNDGVVDAADLDLLMGLWGGSDCSDPADASCRADFNEDGDIGPADLAVVLSAYGDYSCRADFNGDGEVDDVDVDILTKRWGTECKE